MKNRLRVQAGALLILSTSRTPHLAPHPFFDFWAARGAPLGAQVEPWRSQERTKCVPKPENAEAGCSKWASRVGETIISKNAPKHRYLAT